MVPLVVFDLSFYAPKGYWGDFHLSVFRLTWARISGINSLLTKPENLSWS